MLDAGTLGVSTEIATQEILANTSGTPTDCYYMPPATVSAASSSGLRPGTWQLTLTHTIAGYPNPVVCTRHLVAGANRIAFVVGPQTAGCQ